MEEGSNLEQSVARKEEVLGFRVLRFWVFGSGFRVEVGYLSS